ncbi:MAG: sel1 repeat family protein [Chitinophagaceae bacterium]|nr:sel1 repeat family protein [Chitinophagaceae bacterium]
MKNTTLSFSIPDDAEIFFSDQNNTRLKKYTTDSGFIIQPNSKTAEPNYTGPGIFYTNSGKLYAGQFSNGNPQGEGWLFVEGDSEDPTLSYKEHNMYGLFVAGKIQNGWYVAADHIYFSSPNRIISKTDLAAEWAALQKKTESGDTKAMFDFARKYYTYDAIEPNTSKALEWLEKAARADYMPAIKELVDIYSGESASYRSKDKFAADKEKQAYWAGVICKKDKTLAIAERRFERTYFQIYWGHFYYHLNHWYHENGSIKWTNQPFILLNELTP